MRFALAAVIALSLVACSINTARTVRSIATTGDAFTYDNFDPPPSNPAVLRSATNDLDCPEDKLRVSSTKTSTIVDGCGKRAVYEQSCTRPWIDSAADARRLCGSGDASTFILCCKLVLVGRFAM